MKPSSSADFNKTLRAPGWPSLLTVASTMAFGSGTSFLIASCNHVLN